ncbi:MAG: PEGA domain-containing protein [Leptospirillum sp.]|jgi:hypothetical protein
MSRKRSCFSIAFLAVFSLSPMMEYADESGDSSAWTLPAAASSPIPDQTHTLLLISSNPPGAKMQVDGVLIGEPPVSFQAQAGMSGSVCVLKDGFGLKCFSVFFQGGKAIRTQITLEKIPPPNPFSS